LDGEIHDKEFNNSMKNARRKHGDTTNTAVYDLWDFLDLALFHDNKCNNNLFQRKFELLTVLYNCDNVRFTFISDYESKSLEEQIEYFNQLNNYIIEVMKYPKYNHISMVPFKFIRVKDIQSEFEKYHYQFGEEGLILKEIYSPYVYSSNNTSSSNRGLVWFKYKIQDFAKDTGCKALAETTVKITGSYEGTKGTKNEGRLGGFTYIGKIEYEGKEVEITGNVGGGFKDDERIDYWETRDAQIGKLIDIEFQNVSFDKSGSYSLRFPQFKRFRKDL
jgi:hypothetical protein